MEKTRLDALLVQRGLAESRERARALVLAGSVSVDGRRAEKAGMAVSSEARIEVAASRRPFVSRGGEKLDAALGQFGIDVARRVALDVGASTGGFTDCLLKRGAAHVFAVDVGYGQLDWSLRNDPRVTCLERVHAGRLCPGLFDRPIELAVIDVSFISLSKVLPPVAAVLQSEGEIVGLVKPQFEVGRDKVGKGGVVRDPEARRSAVRKARGVAESVGLHVAAEFESPLPGPKGNREVFLHMKTTG